MRMKPLGGPYITRTTVIAALMVAIMGILVLIRLCFGLQSVTNLNNGYPWGLWLAYDMVAGSAIGCGGYAVALVVYALNRGQYHPLVRPAVLASMFGYALGGVSVLIDISRWWNAWHIVWPTYFNFNSVMIEVAVCVCVYTTILMLEFAPAVVEKAVEWTGQRGGNLHALTTSVQKVLNKIIFVLIALGMTLPTMHQSSLGTMLIPFGPLLNPLWQTPVLPALFLLTALCMGYGVVMLEATLVSDRFARPSEARILGLLSRYMIGMLIAFLGIRWGALIYEDKLSSLFTSGGLSLAFLAENALYLIPVIVLWPEHRRMAPRYQFIAAMCILSGGILYRLDAYMIAYGRAGWHYFPSVPELLVTFGMIAVEVLGYVLIVKFFPVLPSVEHAHTVALATNRSVA
jgi:Ni/Fe-hydrogenase subunit HybB-like protein